MGRDGSEVVVVGVGNCTGLFLADEPDVPGHEAVLRDVAANVALRDVARQPAHHDRVVRGDILVVIAREN